MKKLFIYAVLSMLFHCELKGNNIQINNVFLVDQNTATGITTIQFDLNWENSWRITNAAPFNWDAAWVFAKFRVNGGEWQHAWLSDTGHYVTTGLSVTTGLLNPSLLYNGTSNPGLGVFICRNSDGTGNVNISNAKIKWNYAANGVQNNAIVDIQLFAVEMVYVPTGNFWAGDGQTDLRIFNLTLINNSNARMNPVLDSGIWAGGYPHGATPPAQPGFPNGYKSFYCMKYEITQEQYVNYLNSLSRTQQLQVAGVNVGGYLNSSGYSNFPADRSSVKCISDPGSGQSFVYGCDLNQNGIANEANDGQNIAMGNLSLSRLLAIECWMALRPMTELEYEKACRGVNQYPIPGEFAWGSTQLNPVVSLTNSGTSNEGTFPATANCNFDGGGTRPYAIIRAGAIAASALTATRENSGASFYGIMELAGNVIDLTTALSTSNGVAGSPYAGSHGNGQILSNGLPSDPSWDLDNAILKGGSFVSQLIAGLIGKDLQVSYRPYLTQYNTKFDYGGRGVRTVQ